MTSTYLAEFADLIRHPLFPTRANSYVRWYPKRLEHLFDNDFPWHGENHLDGFYIHVPFCDVLCPFCPFNKVPTDSVLVNAFVESLCEEIRIYANQTDHSRISFIYFGGGTPSVLSPKHIERIIEALIKSGFKLSNTEISLEAHPTHLTTPNLRDWQALGINRISTGIQALSEVDLRLLGSNHTDKDVLRGIEALAKVYRNFAIDLLYRFEGHTEEAWGETLRCVIEFRIPHISAYALVSNQAPSAHERMVEARMATVLDQAMHSAGYKHYASCASGGYDYCLDGFECKYELMHWQAPQACYAGLGPGAFGFINQATVVNGLGIEAYTKYISQGMLPFASVKRASQEEMARRFFVLGVKTLSVSLVAFNERFGASPVWLMQTIERLKQDGLAAADDRELVLTPIGRHFVDEVSSAFFSDAERYAPHPEEPEVRRAEVARRNKLAEVKL